MNAITDIDKVLLEACLAKDPKRYYCYQDYKEILLTLESVFWCGLLFFNPSPCGVFLESKDSQTGEKYEIHSRGIKNNDMQRCDVGGNSTLKLTDRSTGKSQYISQKAVGGLTFEHVIAGKKITSPAWESKKFRDMVIFANLRDSGFDYSVVNWDCLTLEQRHRDEFNSKGHSYG